MNYYKTSLLSSPLEALTYSSDLKIKIGSIVEVLLNKRELRGVIVQESEKPDFETTDIGEVSDLYHSPKQIQLAKFISTSYCPLKIL